MTICQNNRCCKRAYFNFEGETKAIYCSEHKEPNMVDIKHKRCKHSGCNTRAWCGIPGKQPSSCAVHKTEGMLKHPRSGCKINKCKKLALYGYTKQLHCEEHKLEDEYNLVEQRCIDCELLDILDENNYCSDCGDFKFKRIYLAKQKEIKAFLDVNKKKYELYDKAVDRSCGLERPDFLFDAPTHKIILEVDENQHSNYECEKTRMINISQTIGMPVIFLRYNPDKFKGTKISKSKRQKILLEWLDHCTTLSPNKPEDFLRVIKLFYNGYKEGNVSVENIIIDGI